MLHGILREHTKNMLGKTLKYLAQTMTLWNCTSEIAESRKLV